MPKRPLLIFPTPAVAGRDKMKPRFGSPNYHFPSPQRQKDKLTRRFESMLQSFITDSTAGIEPEFDPYKGSTLTVELQEGNCANSDYLRCI